MAHPDQYSNENNDYLIDMPIRREHIIQENNDPYYQQNKLSNIELELQKKIILFDSHIKLYIFRTIVSFIIGIIAFAFDYKYVVHHVSVFYGIIVLILLFFNINTLLSLFCIRNNMPYFIIRYYYSYFYIECFSHFMCMCSLLFILIYCNYFNIYVIPRLFYGILTTLIYMLYTPFTKYMKYTDSSQQRKILSELLEGQRYRINKYNKLCYINCIIRLCKYNNIELKDLNFYMTNSITSKNRINNIFLLDNEFETKQSLIVKFNHSYRIGKLDIFIKENRLTFEGNVENNQHLFNL